MVILSLYVVCSTFLIAYLAYYSLRSHHQRQQIEQRIHIANMALTQAEQQQERLQDELCDLQQQVRDTEDDLTPGALSWPMFETKLSHYLQESARYHFMMALVFIRIDNLDLIHNALGRDAVQLALCEMSERLRGCIRRADSLSRFNQDTFAVTVTQLSKPETAVVVVQRLLQVFGQAFKLNDYEVNLTASMGVSVYPADGEEVAALLSSAELALSLAMDKGDHSYQFFQAKMHANSQRELALYSSLSRDNVFQELAVFYQPVFNVQNDTVVCMETLLAWQHEEYGTIGPEELCHYALRQRKWNAISEWLIHKAGQQYRQWRSLGYQPGLLGISLSLKQLESSQFVYRLSQLLQDIKFNPQWLLIEIKDNFSHASLDILEKSFNMLNYLGVKIAVDYFGADSLSLRCLKKLKIHYLKLDPSFADDIVANSQTQALIKSMVALADNLGIPLIVPGVETTEQVQSLKTLGCYLLQGQLLSGPLSETDAVNKMTVLTP